MASTVSANLILKESNQKVYPNTTANNVALASGKSLEEFASTTEDFVQDQEALNSEISEWKDDTEAWKSTHTHTTSQISNISSYVPEKATKVSNDLVITFNGGTVENDTKYTFNGSRKVTLDITPDKVGSAAYFHEHEASDITDLEERIAEQVQTVTPSKHTHTISDVTDLSDTLTSMELDGYYDSTVPTTVTLGGIEAGYTPAGGRIRLKDLLYNLLHPYVAPKVTASASPSNGGTVEWNTTQTISQVTVNCTMGSNPFTKIEVYQGSSLLKSVTTVNSGANYVSLTDVTITKDSTYKYLTVRLYDSSGKYVSANTGTFSFVYPYYYGVSSDIPTADTVSSMTKKIAAKGNQTISYTMTQQRAVFACYKGNGALSTILDANGFDSTGTFTRIELTIGTLTYYVYYNNPSTNTNFNFTFKY